MSLLCIRYHGICVGREVESRVLAWCRGGPAETPAHRQCVQFKLSRSSPLSAPLPTVVATAYNRSVASRSHSLPRPDRTATASRHLLAN